MKRLIVVAVALVACACPTKQAAGPIGAGSGTGDVGGDPPVTSATCDGARAKVEQLYRAEAQAKEPNRVAEAVADNTAMVMADCARSPATVTACIAQASTAKDLEARCLVPLDDEGSEGGAPTP